MEQEVARTVTPRKRRPIKPPEGQYISERADGLHGAISPTDESGPPRPAPEDTHRLPCGDLTELNTSRAILDSVGKRMLKRIAGSAIDVLGTSVAVYEKNGDCALGIYSSDWCRFLNDASRRLCNTRDTKKALDSGKWHCHESCWHDAAKVAIDTGRCVDIACRGGIRLYAVPIRAGEEIVGAFSIGYGDPPSDGRKLASLARRYRVKAEELRRKAGTCRPRPLATIEAAKKMLLTSADLIGKIVQIKRAQEALKDSQHRYKELFEGIRDGVILCGREGDILDCNKHILRQLGYTRRAFLCLRIRDIVELDSYETIKQTENRLLAGKTVVLESALRCKDGRCIPAEIIAQKIQYHDQPAVLATARDITKRKQAEEALRKSEQQARALMNATTDTALLVDPAGRIIAINEAGARRFGKTADQIVGVCVFDLMPPDVAERRKAAMKEVLRTGRAVRSRDERGGMVFDNAALPICDSEGKVRQFAVFASDVTQQVRAEEAIRREIDKWAGVLNAMGDSVSIVDRDHNIVYLNRAMMKDFGPVAGRKCYAYFLDRTEPCPACRRFPVSEGRTLCGETRFPKTGKLYEFLDTPLENPEGNIWSLEILRDVTDRKQAEEELRKAKADLEARVRQRTYDLTRTVEELEGEVRDRIRAEQALKKSEEKYRALAENTLDIIYSIDRNGNLNYVSPQVERYGFDAQQLISQSILKLVYEDDKRRVASALQRTIFSKQAHVTEFRGKSNDGRLHWFEDRGTVQVDESGHTLDIIGVLRDITEKMAAEEAIREGEKLAATGRMAARIAHEINNPLAGIKNSFLLIKDGIPADHPYNSYVSRIENEIERISRIVRQMFNVYRPGTEGPSEFVVEDVLADLVALLEPECRLRGVTIITQMPRIPTKVLLKKDSVVQILFNIIQNAIEASSRMSSVKVTVKPSGDSLVICVGDQGKGISKSLRSIIFEPFFTTKASPPRLAAASTNGLDRSQPEQAYANGPAGRLPVCASGPQAGLRFRSIVA